MSSNQVGHRLSPQPLEVPIMIFLVEHLRTRHIIHTYLPAFTHTFYCTKDASTNTTGKYIHRHMICHISLKIYFSPQPIGHSSKMTFSGIFPCPQSQPCLELCVPITVMQLICGKVTNIYARVRSVLANVIFDLEGVLFILNWFNTFMLRFTIKFHISSFDGEEQKICYVFTWQKSFGIGQLPCNRQELSGSTPFLSSPHSESVSSYVAFYF